MSSWLHCPGLSTAKLSVFPMLCALLLASATHALAERIRGVTVSTHYSGEDWASPSISPTFDELRQLGANWVAIHPYGWIRDDGEVRFAALDVQRPPAHLARPIEEAHRRGLRILIKPHLGYWGSQFSWRGEIAFGSEEQWERFFTTYERWIVGLARAAGDVDGFCVGTELDRTVPHESRWRQIIRAVREQTRAPLCYAANWNTYSDVAFWDALDIIGVQGYFPLHPGPGPTRTELDAAWAEILRDLRSFSEQQERYVVLTELGYPRHRRAAIAPWEHGSEGSEAEPLQAACMRSALRAIEHEPRVIGAFLWKWFPLPRSVGRDYQLATPIMMQTIREVWASP